MVVVAVTVSLLRGALLFVNEYRNDLVAWVTRDKPVHISVGHLSARLEKFKPVLVLEDALINPKQSNDYQLKVGSLLLEIDWLQSLNQRSLVLTDLTLDKINLEIPWWGETKGDSAGVESAQVLAGIFLHRLDHFSVTNSQIAFIMPDNTEKLVHIQALRWLNDGEHHQGQGQALLVDQSASGSGGIDFTLDLVGNVSDLESLQGKLFAHGEKIDLNPIANVLNSSSASLLHSDLNFSLWGEFGGGVSPRLQVNVEPSLLKWQDNGLPQQLNIQQGHIQLTQYQQNKVRLDSQGWEIYTNGKLWPSLQIQGLLDAHQQQLYVNQLDLSAVVPLVSALPGVTGQNLPRVTDGRLEEIRISYVTAAQALSWEANLSPVTTTAHDNILGVKGLAGKLWGDNSSGYFDLAMTNSQMDYSSHFPKPWQVNELVLSGRVGWSPLGLQIQGNRTLVDTPEFRFDGAWRVDWHQGQALPWLSLYGQADIKAVGDADLYLPNPGLPERVSDYLKNALVSGQAEQVQLLWHGYLGEYPYTDNQGVFQAFIPVKKAEFKFQPTWPALVDADLDLLFQNRSLHIATPKLAIGQLHASQVSAGIEYLGHGAELVIAADVSGSAEAASNYLKSTPLKALRQTMEQVQLSQGDLSGKIYLNIPFKNSWPKVSGYVDFNGNQVYLAPLKSFITDVKGRLQFKDQALTARRLTGNWQGMSTQFDLRSKLVGENYDLDIDLKGDWPVRRIESTYHQSWLADFDGSLGWQALVNLSLQPGGKLAYNAKGSTTLEGVTSALPAPLGKTALEPMATTFSLKGNELISQLDVEAGEYLNARLRLSTQKGLSVMSARIDVGESRWVRVIPDHGLVLSSRLDNLDVKPWIDWLAKRPASNSSSQSSASDSSLESSAAPESTPSDDTGLSLASADFKVKQGRYQDQPLDNLSVTYLKSRQTWNIEADQLQAKMVQPVSASLSTPWLLTIDRAVLPNLRLPQKSDVVPDVEASVIDTAESQDDEVLPEDTENETPKPRPPLRIACKVCQFGSYQLGEVNLWLPYQDDKLEGGQLSVNMGHSQIQAQFDWLPDAGGYTSRVTGSLLSQSAEKLIRDLGVDSPLQQTSLKSQFNLSWAGELSKFDRGSLNGHLSLDAGEGVLTEIDDQGTRLLTLGSLDSIRRRLKLDFRDVFDKGLFFDSAKANVVFEHGVASNQDFYMDAVPGILRGKGFANLYSGKVDYEISFAPKLTSSLPILAAFAVTPVTGVAVYALSKLFEPVIEVVTQVKFKIHGNIDQPELIEVDRLKQKIEIPDHLKRQPSSD
jgi:uncharacterized protein (TIGR02099 family)